MFKLIPISFILFCVPTYGQEKEISIYEADSVSYGYFINKETSKLNNYAAVVLTSGLDFYYLRIRTGILNYDQNNYETSLPHFKKALEFAPEDTLTQEYLFYNHLFLRHNVSAKSTYDQMSESCQIRLQRDKPSTNLFMLEADSLSFDYFKTNKLDAFEQLLATCENKGVKFFDLHSRAGILNYNAKNYSISEIQLNKALEFDQNNSVLQEYLFYTYIYQGKNKDAIRVFDQLSDKDQARLRKDKPTLNMINFEGGFMTSSANSVLSNLPLRPAKIYEEKDVMQSLLYVHLGYFRSLKKRTSVYTGFSYTDLAKQKTISFPTDTINSYNFKQTQVYLGLTHDLKSKWNLQMGINLIAYNALPTFAYYDATLFKYQFYTFESKATNIATNFGGSKIISKHVGLNLDAGFSIIDKQLAFQEKIELTLFPLKKSAYFTIGFALSHDSIETRNVWSLKIGGKILRKISIETYSFFGNLRNYNDVNAFVVYNVSDKINLKIGTIFRYSLNKSIEMNLRYDLLQRESGFYTLENDFTGIATTYKYINNTLILGIKWKF